MKKIVKSIWLLTLIIQVVLVFGQEKAVITIIPQPYEKALKNPMMGFTSTNVDNHPWATLSHTYIRWDELENDESGIYLVHVFVKDGTVTAKKVVIN